MRLALPPLDQLPEPGPAFRFRLEPGDAAFQGHFPGDPVLPGVVQVDWAIRLAGEALGPLGAFQGLDRVKFLRPLRPGDTGVVRLAPAGPGRVGFRYELEGGLASSGTLVFAP